MKSGIYLPAGTDKLKRCCIFLSHRSQYTTIPFRKLITGIYPLEGLEKGLLEMEQGADVMKILIDCAS